MTQDYQDRHVVVTGAATGVGAALVQKLREAGAGRISAIDRKKVTDADDFYEVDLSDRSAVEGVVGELSAVDVLFNNAGVAANLPLPVVMGVNVFAPRLLSRELAKSMPAGGAVVNTASIAGLQYPERLPQILELLAIDDWGQAVDFLADKPDCTRDPYSFSKECSQVFTMLAGTEMSKQGLRINSACPGIIETPLIPDFQATMGAPIMDWMVAQGSGSMAKPEQIADVLLFLGSPGSSYMNGTNVICDSGFSAALNTNQADFSTLPM